MVSGDQPRPPSQIANGSFSVERKLGTGCFGEVWRGCKKDTGEVVAVKCEDFQARAQQLEHEAEILQTIAKPTLPQGFATCLYFGREGRYRCLVMDLLGKSLEDRMQSCEGPFTPQTAVLVAEQILHRIEYLHSKGIVHRDIKPENFMFGTNKQIHHVYLIDFGLSKRYFDAKHVNQKMKLSLTGTARYASINAHRGSEQSRRDDLEAIGHMLMYFLRGSLPWSGLEAKTQEEKYRKIREKKEEVMPSDLCSGHPEAFQEYLEIARGLDFKERPQYGSLRKLFRHERDKIGRARGQPIEDHEFQWFEGKDLGTLVPIQSPEKIQQPDDGAPKRSFFGLCGGKARVRD